MTVSAVDTEYARWQEEVLRRASAILGGKPVGVWEVRPDQSLVPVASNVALALAEGAAPKVRDALRRIHMPSPPGSRWVGGQLVTSAGWCVAPVRTVAPEPPAHRERRSRGRLALELAGLCLGLSDRLTAAVAELRDPRYQQAPDSAIRVGMLKGLEDTERALDDTAFILARSRDHARGGPAGSGDFDVIPVIRTVVEAARAAAAQRGATIEVETLGPVAPVIGDASQLRSILVLLIQSAVLALAGRRDTVALTVADVGPVVRITIRVPAVIAESAIAAARHVVETGFGGDLSVASHPAEPGTTVMLRLAARQESFPHLLRPRQGPVRSRGKPAAI
jgi:signal transduction histidine kinase